MSSTEYKIPDLGITVTFNFGLDFEGLGISYSIWFSIVRVLLKAIDKMVIQPLQNICFQITKLRESIIIESEVSKARIHAGKLIEVTKVYEFRKKDVDKLELNEEAKQKLIQRLDTALDIQIDQIIRDGA